MLLYAPDKNRLEWKAVDDACKATGLTPVKLLDRCGAIASSHDYHLGAFLREHFPRGTGFGDAHELPDPPSLPDAGVRAFSMDDAATTEIDDAFSVMPLDNGNWRVGIHIAVPALGIPPASALDDIAARRLSTVYYPGGKITMLPDGAIHHYTLGETHTCPALSMYVEVSNGDWTVLSQETRLEQVHIAANLRHETLEAHFHTGSIADDSVDYPFKRELDMLWHFSGALEAARGKTPDPNQPQRQDYNFKVEHDRVSITDRARGNPIDRVVSELMIYANSEWGRWLAETETMALYRTQQNGKVKMSTKPAPSRRSRRGAIHLGQLAAAALRRPGQSAPAGGAGAGRRTAVRAQIRNTVYRAARFRTGLRCLQRLPAAHGALLVPALVDPGKRQRHQRRRDQGKSGALGWPAVCHARAVAAGIAARQPRQSDSGRRGFI
jgi:Exoribonuclease R